MKRRLVSTVKLKEILKNPSPNLKVPVYDVGEEGINSVKKTTTKITLSQRMEHLETIVIDGFKQVNTRIDNIEKRLDYNGLKKLPSDK